MKRLIFICGVVLVMLGASAGGAGKANTKVTFEGASSHPSDGSTQYYGRISSPKKACANERKVSVYMKGSGPGTGTKIGSTRSRPGKGGSFLWIVTQTDPPMAGTYYAKAKPTDKCRGDRSKDFLFVR